MPDELAIGTLRILRDLTAEVGMRMVDFAHDLRQADDKGAIDLVTGADKMSEEVITTALAGHFPEHRIAAEEGTCLGPADSPWIWHIDPLDGTANYHRSLPYWAISIGLSHGEEPVLGIVHAPQAGITVLGSVGLGAWHGDRPLPRASEPGPPRSWIIATDWPWDVAERERTGRLLGGLAPRIRQYKTYGSAAIDLAHVALGLVDAYLISHIFRWDQAGGTAILRALGYDLRTWTGAPWDLGHRDIAACRPGMWEELGPISARAWRP